MSNFNILKEGYKPIAIVFIISLVVNIFINDLLGNLTILFVLFTIYVYRDPKRYIYPNDNTIVAPIDGKITAIDYVDGKQKVYCDVNLCDTHILRAPIDGKFKIKSFYNGLNLSTSNYKAKSLNERVTIKFPQLKLKLLSGVCNNKILIDNKNEQEIKKGKRIGLFFNGQVIIETKKALNLFVKIGDKVKAGETTIGKYDE